MSGAGRRRRKHKGGAIMKPQMGGAKIGKILKEVNKVAKETKILSHALGAIPHPYAQGASTVAKSLGYGKRKRRHKMKGRGIERLGDSVLGIGYQISHPVF